MSIIVVKELRKKVKEAKKQISLEAIQMINNYVDKMLIEIINKQKSKRITGKTLEY